MSVKFPLLEQLRADRLVKEAEIKKPIVEKLNQANYHINDLYEEKHQLEEFNAKKCRQYVLECISDKFAADLMIYIKKAALPYFPNAVTICIDPGQVDWADPKGIQKQIYNELIKKLEFGVVTLYNHEKKVTTVEIHIPKYTYRYNVVDQ